MNRRFVFDASVAVLWFLDQAGSDAARAISTSREVVSGEVVMAWPSVIETVDVVGVRRGPIAAETAWDALHALCTSIVETDAALMDDAIVETIRLDCRLYDAVPVALAGRLGATLVSADRRAHAGVEDALLLG